MAKYQVRDGFCVLIRDEVFAAGSHIELDDQEWGMVSHQVQELDTSDPKKKGSKKELLSSPD